MSAKQELLSKIERMNREINEVKEDRKVLKQMELFVLDNSLRESTVGQLRGHTIENKWKIYEQVEAVDVLCYIFSLNVWLYLCSVTCCLRFWSFRVARLISRVKQIFAITNNAWSLIWGLASVIPWFQGISGINASRNI